MVSSMQLSRPRPAFFGAVIALLLAVLSGCGTGSDDSAESPATAAAGPTTCAYPADAAATAEVDPPPAEPTVSGTVSAVIATGQGNLNLSLDADSSPCTVGSFASLAAQGFYDGTTCHRLTTEGIFVLQCGDPTGTGSGGPGYSFADEVDGSETYPAGTVAMANAGPDTNGSQFFLVYDDSSLPPDYTVFGQLDEKSTQLVADIAAKGTDTGAGDGAPKEPVEITGVTLS